LVLSSFPHRVMPMAVSGFVRCFVAASMFAWCGALRRHEANVAFFISEHEDMSMAMLGSNASCAAHPHCVNDQGKSLTGTCCPGPTGFLGCCGDHPNPPAECSAYPACYAAFPENPDASCCPTDEGVLLTCCRQANPMCDAHPGCVAAGLSGVDGKCCPADYWGERYLDCCSNKDMFCEDHPACVAEGKTGTCCPSVADGVMDACCNSTVEEPPFCGVNNNPVCYHGGPRSPLPQTDCSSGWCVDLEVRVPCNEAATYQDRNGGYDDGKCGWEGVDPATCHCCNQSVPETAGEGCFPEGRPLHTDCCPTSGQSEVDGHMLPGVTLWCCDSYSPPAECSVNAGCAHLPYGNCCPDDDGVMLDCCIPALDSHSLSSQCENYPGCAHLSGDCCPTTDGAMLWCCNKNPSCAANAGCEQLSGACCPDETGSYNDCCPEANYTCID